MWTKYCHLALICVAVTLLTATAQAFEYRVEVLPEQPEFAFERIQYEGINNNGHVIGTVRTTQTISETIIYHGGSFSRYAFTGAHITRGGQINDRDEFVGSLNRSGLGVTGFLYRDGQFYLQTSPIDGGIMYPRALNNRGTHAGILSTSEHYPGSSNPYVQIDNTLFVIPMEPQWLDNGMLRLNEQNIGLGYYLATSASRPRYFTWSERDGRTDRPPNEALFDLSNQGTLLGLDVNDQIFLEHEGQKRLLGPGWGARMNEMGDVIINLSDDDPPVLRWRNGISVPLLDLTDPGSGLTRFDWIQDFNDRGQILALCTVNGRQYTQVILHPVPEPSTVVALGSLSLLLLSRRRT